MLLELLTSSQNDDRYCYYFTELTLALQLLPIRNDLQFLKITMEKF